MENYEEIGYIDKDTIFNYTNEIEIFQLVFKHKINEYEHIKSPFRKDKNPGCWFEFDLYDNKLKFRDFATGKKPLDCFDVVQRFFNLPNFYKTLLYIKKNLIIKKGLEKKEQKPIKNFKDLNKIIKVKIIIKTRDFTLRDKKYWKNYGITKINLVEDGVFPIEAFKMFNTKKGDILIKTQDISYAYTDFIEERKKIYRPLNKKNKFFTNCINNDIGGIKNLSPFGKQLVITKSYKDYRVLKNFGLNVIWFQSENIFPSNKVLRTLCNKFKNIVIFFDNDKQGLASTKKLNNLINDQYPSKSRSVFISEEYLIKGIKDPSDFIKEFGSQKLQTTLQQFKLTK